jgi:hypothetical protein
MESKIAFSGLEVEYTQDDTPHSASSKFVKSFQLRVLFGQVVIRNSIQVSSKSQPSFV